MKYIKIYILIAILGVFSSCEDELYQDPITDKSASNYYKTETEIEEAVVAEIGLILAALLAGCGFFLTFLAKSFLSICGVSSRVSVTATI